jgi:UDP-glucose 4-epimerase
LGNEFHVFGADFSTPDGSAIRDYTHVSDLAEAHLNALRVISDAKQDVVCNIGTGTGVSVFELAEAVRNLGFQISVKVMPRRNGDPARLVAANKLSRSKLDMRYENSNILTILDTAVKWHSLSENNPH